MKIDNSSFANKALREQFKANLKRNYYTIATAAKYTGISRKLLCVIANNKPLMYGCITYKNRHYFLKSRVHENAANVFCNRKRIVQTFRSFLNEVGSKKNTYAMTIAFQTTSYTYSYIEVQSFLDKICTKMSKEIYGNAWRKKGLYVRFLLFAENINSNMHVHGYLILPQKIKSKKHGSKVKYLQRILTKFSKYQFINSSVRVSKIDNFEGWSSYCTKQFGSNSDCRADESFEELMNRILICNA